jgi:4-hydroxyphenylpyruvate dioxygenase
MGMADLFDNPLGTNGFSFIEYAGDAAFLEKLFKSYGFEAVGTHKTRDITLYRQGKINFLLNREVSGQGADFAKVHGAGASAMGFLVKDADYALAQAVKAGATEAKNHGGSFDGTVPAIDGIGGSLLYLIEDEADFIASHFNIRPEGLEVQGAGLTYIDHVTHNVHRGNMVKWADFYTNIFNFQEVRYFDIEGKLTGLKSKAMTSPCGKIRIPLNESSDDKSQIQEFLERFNGEGIQHIALGTDDIYSTVEDLRGNAIPFQRTPDTYYARVDARVPEHGEDLERLKELQILVDGAPTKGQGLLLQIFTQDAMGPVFFEIIQRKGNEGFGEGNFKALFESIEEDQIRRGVLKDPSKQVG